MFTCLSFSTSAKLVTRMWSRDHPTKTNSYKEIHFSCFPPSPIAKEPRSLFSSQQTQIQQRLWFPLYSTCMNMSNPTGIADLNFSWSYSRIDTAVQTLIPNTSTQSQDLFKDCLGFCKGAVPEPWSILLTKGNTWRKFLNIPYWQS